MQPPPSINTGATSSVATSSSSSPNTTSSPTTAAKTPISATTDMEKTPTATTPSTSAPLTRPPALKEYLYKILVVGDLGTGKTSIIKRYVHNIFSMHYKSTIGVDFALKVIQWSPDTVIRLQLWDIAGQERFGNMTRVYYKEAVGALVVFDVTRISTFDGVAKWKADIDDKVRLPDGSAIPVVLLANKVDLAKDAVVKRLDGYCKEQGFSAWFETSAKDNLNIDDACRFLVSRVLENDRAMAAQKAVSGSVGSKAARSGIVRVGRDDESAGHGQGGSSGRCC